MLQFLVETEDRMAIEKSELEFKQQVRISPLNLFYTDLWDRLFTPGYVPPSEMDDVQAGVFFPSSPDEFDEMVEEFEREKIEQEIQGVFNQSLKT